MVVATHTNSVDCMAFYSLVKRYGCCHMPYQILLNNVVVIKEKKLDKQEVQRVHTQEEKEKLIFD